MKAYVFRPQCGVRNFGDELNLWLWDRYLPELKDSGDGLLMGIGTLLDQDLPKERPLIVFGSGAGYGSVPDLSDVDVRFVRGPKTANAIGMPGRGITDPAILVHGLIEPKPVRDVAFVPRWTVVTGEPDLADKLAQHGIFTVDPTWEVDRVLREIAGTRLIVTEAFHGAVVADALRIPWIPVYAEVTHFFKWFDWTASMGMHYDPVAVVVSGLLWAKDNSCPQLSSDSVFRARLWEVQEQVKRLRKDLKVAA